MWVIHVLGLLMLHQTTDILAWAGCFLAVHAPRFVTPSGGIDCQCAWLDRVTRFCGLLHLDQQLMVMA
jgi:hypothetical protein